MNVKLSGDAIEVAIVQFSSLREVEMGENRGGGQEGVDVAVQ